LKWLTEILEWFASVELGNAVGFMIFFALVITIKNSIQIACNKSRFKESKVHMG